MFWGNSYGSAGMGTYVVVCNGGVSCSLQGTLLQVAGRRFDPTVYYCTVLLTGGRCHPQHPWGSSSPPEYKKVLFWGGLYSAVRALSGVQVATVTSNGQKLDEFSMVGGASLHLCHTCRCGCGARVRVGGEGGPQWGSRQTGRHAGSQASAHSHTRWMGL